MQAKYFYIEKCLEISPLKWEIGPFAPMQLQVKLEVFNL
jgi:hypothetical protein